MIAILTFLFLALLTFLSNSQTAYDGCQFELTDTNGMTATYDLSYFDLNKHTPSDVFRVTDAQNTYFEYAFNICGAIDPQIMIQNITIPHACSHPNSNHGPCIETRQVKNSTIPECNRYENTAGKSPSALQIDTYNNWTQCYWLGMEVSAADEMPEYKMELLNKNDAGKGVIFTILNGEWCKDVGRNRELRIKLECPDDNRIEFEPGVHQTQIESEVVTEIDTCVYELAVVSPNACPHKCISRMNLEMFAVCATHGICAADPYSNGEESYPNGSLRCLCDDGYMGDICEKINTEIRIIDQTHPGLLAAIVICIILLGVAIVCAAVLCHKIRMKELEETQSMDHLSGGMLADEQDAQLQQTKVQAMTMNIGNQSIQQTGDTTIRQPTSTAAVQLHTVDDQLESDKVEDTNELLDDEVQETTDAGTSNVTDTVTDTGNKQETED